MRQMKEHPTFSGLTESCLVSRFYWGLLWRGWWYLLAHSPFWGFSHQQDLAHMDHSPNCELCFSYLFIEMKSDEVRVQPLIFPIEDQEVHQSLECHRESTVLVEILRRRSQQQDALTCHKWICAEQSLIWVSTEPLNQREAALHFTLSQTKDR